MPFLSLRWVAALLVKDHWINEKIKIVSLLNRVRSDDCRESKLHVLGEKSKLHVLRKNQNYTYWGKNQNYLYWEKITRKAENK